MRSMLISDEKNHLEIDVDTLHAGIVAKFERCPYCNTKLLFTHDLSLAQLEVTENARCPGCGMHTTPQKHSIQ